MILGILYFSFLASLTTSGLAKTIWLLLFGSLSVKATCHIYGTII